MEFRKSLLDWGDGSNKPRTHIKKPEVQGHVYNPGGGVAETGRPLGFTGQLAWPVC